ncbi:hypothetical protein PGTUg99_035126 [Puccinia graminis f. sp. tritici]|uniref:Uncharacterized protein n=1 Tax=Puccinia graminis f. sp. tritici TaxID=56615 RepID=A0A5B0SEJ5_PUCGR|nr:hypothetical protein PGTUg99_035126 [Puccinia graminis f. sp. tritici]
MDNLVSQRYDLKRTATRTNLSLMNELLIHQLASDSSSRSQPTHPLSDIDLSQKHQIHPSSTLSKNSHLNGSRRLIPFVLSVSTSPL